MGCMVPSIKDLIINLHKLGYIYRKVDLPYDPLDENTKSKRGSTIPSLGSCLQEYYVWGSFGSPFPIHHLNGNAMHEEGLANPS